MLAPQPVPDFDPSESTDDVRAKVREKLAQIRKRAQTGRLNSDSTLFKLKKKLTEFGGVNDVARRRAMLAASPEEGAGEETQDILRPTRVNGAHLPDPIPDPEDVAAEG